MRWWLCVVLAGCHFRAGAAAGDAATDLAIDVPADIAPDTIPADWWDPSWHHRRAITIDTSTLTNTLGKFPVLITVPNTFDYADARSDGADLRLVDGTGAVLPYDLDTWSPSNTSWLWVSVSLPQPPTPAPIVWLYYGNATAAAGAAPAAVWTQYISVHHLANLTDASGHGHDGTSSSVATTPIATSGIVGQARAFDGTDDEIDLPTSTAYDLSAQMSVSLWVHGVVFTSQWQCFVCKGDSAWRVHRGNTTSHADFGSTVSGIQGNLDSTSNVDDGGWHHIAVDYNGTNKAIYIDGTREATAASAAFSTNTFAVVFGENVEAGARFYQGDLDEVRIDTHARGQAWFAVEYRNVTDRTFATLGPDQAIP